MYYQQLQLDNDFEKVSEKFNGKYVIKARFQRRKIMF